MDDQQKDHLKSYGIAFWTLKNNEEVDWLLNYRGGSFMAKYDKKTEDECKVRGVTYEVLTDATVNSIVTQINDPSVNMDLVKLQKAPKIAVYSPKNRGPLEDAVVLVLNYAEIPFDYTFLDKKFERLYKSEQLQGTLFTIFSSIAIFIACLGLFGLSAFTISQRFKEIGVRKVLGASVPQIVTELSRDFLKLVLIAAIIALPIAWYSMSRWLLDFAFRIELSWWIFVLAGVMAMLIAFATISIQSIKAAIANPVKSLRSE